MRKLKNEELNRISPQEFKSSDKNPIIIVLDNIRSMLNIGSIFRTCDAFRIEAIYLCGITATPPHREIERTALGATESVNWRYFNSTVEAVEELKENNFSVFAVEQTDKSILLNKFKVDQSHKIALIFGNEVEGVSNDAINLAEGCIEIPQYGTKHSLNISVSVGIVIWNLILNRIS